MNLGLSIIFSLFSLLISSKLIYSQSSASFSISCEHLVTVMDTAIHHEFEGSESKKDNILFINSLAKKEGIEYAVLFIDKRFLYRAESFFNRFSEIETFKYNGFECVYTSDSITFNTTCFKPSKLTKELYLKQIDDKNVELSKIKNFIGSTYCPMIYMYRYWADPPFGWSRIEL